LIGIKVFHCSPRVVANKLIIARLAVQLKAASRYWMQPRHGAISPMLEALPQTRAV
jgi:hypothetical protein